MGNAKKGEVAEKREELDDWSSLSKENSPYIKL
jgi:hypothetical protein